MRVNSINVRFKTDQYSKLMLILSKNKDDAELNTIHKLIKFIVEDYLEHYEQIEDIKASGTTEKLDVE